MENYNQTDQYIHQISQVLAKLGRSFVPEKDDDSHINLYWEPLHKRMLGRWISTSNGNVLPAIQLEHLTFQWLNPQMNVIDEVTFENTGLTELEVLIENTFDSHGIIKKNFRDPLHFNIPDYPFKNQPFKRFNRADLQEWSFYRSLANHILKDIEAFLNLNIEVRIWPHHFDSGIYIKWIENLGIGAGLAMKDSLAGIPYFYISGYTGEEQINYINVMPLTNGKWIKEGSWKGAILPITVLENSLAYEITQEFFSETLQFFIKYS